MKKTTKGIHLFILLLAFAYAGGAQAKMKLYYAGIAYMGQYTGKDLLYPYTARLMRDQERQLQDALRTRLQNVKNNSFDLVIGAQPVDYKKDDAMTMAFALEYENISLEQIKDSYKVDIDLRANVLIYNFKDMIVVSSYPVAIQLRDLSDHKPSGEELLQKIRALYVEDGSINIFDEFSKRLARVDLKPHYNNTIKVRKVTIESPAETELPRANKTSRDYSVLLAQMFSSYLSKNQNVSVLPYTKGHAIGNKMALQIANGDVYNLKIPNETYAIDLTLRKFSKANLGNNKYKSVWGYASYFAFQVSIPDEDDKFVDAKFRGLVTKSILRDSSHAIYEWALYSESMNKLFDEFTQHISEPDPEWLSNVTATKNVVAQLDKFNDIIKSCR